MQMERCNMHRVVMVPTTNQRLQEDETKHDERLQSTYDRY